MQYLLTSAIAAANDARTTDAVSEGLSVRPRVLRRNRG
jgi:hypothetical protein